MTKRRMALIFIVGALVLIGAAVSIVLLTDSSLLTGEPDLPKVTLTPPVSLSELAESYPEMAELLQDPELGSIYKEFLIAYQEGGEEAAIDLAKERGLLTPDEKNLRVMLVLDTKESTALQNQLEALGVTVVSAYQDRINIAVPVALVTEAMDSEETAEVFKSLTELEHVIAVRLPPQRTPDEQGIFGEGVPVINADAWHDAGYTGQGLHIGVLDLGFNGYEALLGQELPEQIDMETFGGWYDEDEVHGTACAEIIHEVAPDARLSFAWYDGTDPAMGEAVEWLMDQGVDIISQSAGSVVAPRDGTGWDAQLVNSISDQGILWINSAGNDAAQHYRGTFTDQDGDGLHEFTPGEEMLAIYNEGYLEVYLIWDDAWTAPTQDYELYLVDAEGEAIAASEDAQDGGEGQNPVEWIQIPTDLTVLYAVVMAYDTDRAVTFDIFAHGAGAEIYQSVAGYSVGTPADATQALAVGAVDWDNDQVAYYSSQGPTNDERLKPEISAPTGVSGATYGNRGFDGTSASAPHVAGAAALVWQAHPEYQRTDVFDYLLVATQDLGPSGPDTAYGFGRLALPAPPAAIVATPTATAQPTPDATTEPDTTPTPPLATATAGPQPTSTPVSFTTPTPSPDDDEETLALGLTALGLIIGGMGLGGLGLLVGGGILLITTRSATRSRQRTAAQPAPHRSYPAPPPSPPPPPPQKQKPEPPRRAAPTRCPACGASVRAGAKFCSSCGEPIIGSFSPTVKAKPTPKYCRYCGAAVRLNSKFCPKCGKELST